MNTQEISLEVFEDKYKQPGEEKPEDAFKRIAKAFSAQEKDQEHWEKAYKKALDKGVLMGGRIMAAAGAGIETTLISCFVQPVRDSMESIMNALGQSAETMRRGGGEGYNFSKIRPKGAKVKTTGSIASGPISYMHMFNSMCETISSKGARRGAQMGILNVDHPDIEEFIASKALPWDKKPLKGFNLSIGVTDEFMKAVKSDLQWMLVHSAEPSEELKQNGAYQRDDGLWVYREVSAQALWAQIMCATYDYGDPGVVFLTRINAENNLYYCETIEATNPCGEQPLPDYACCDLGPINLTKLIKNPFTEQAVFDYDLLDELVAIAVRMLDLVLDITYWPLDEQRIEAMNKRRIGLGFTGLADALLMLGLRYDSDEGRDTVSAITRHMRDCAYRASIDLAKEKGSFPLFDAEQYLNSGFAKRLPNDIRQSIKKHGIRNSHLLSIAPTGTVSLAFGDNCSSGVEPVYEWAGKRMVKQPDGSWKEYEVVNHALRQYIEVTGDTRPVNKVIDDLPDHWVKAMEISAEDHLAMVKAVAPYIDSSVSKTINVATDYDYERFKGIYIQAHEMGLKGVTTFRDSGQVETVLKSTDHKSDSDGDSSNQQPEPAEELDLSDPDRRLRLDTVPTATLASLRWMKRPFFPEGNPAWISLVEPPNDARFAVVVGHVENGENYPFEVWVNGAEQPRVLGALAKSLSMDMRSRDRVYLKAKLDSLAKTSKDKPFMLTMPNSKAVMVNSTVSAFAHVVIGRCDQLGAFGSEQKTPVMDAMLFKKEPKTGSNGTMSWSVDVRNGTTGDDFVMTLKELTLPCGTRRPYSLWISGEYPSAMDGLCKSLSWDMRVSDPAWIGAKLRQLADYGEIRGDFWAQVPGDTQTHVYPSTIAYIVKLIIHRFAMLGILDEEGYPINPLGVAAFDDQDADDRKLRAVGSTENKHLAGARCHECGIYAVIPRDGCDYCTACGSVGSCG